MRVYFWGSRQLNRQATRLVLAVKIECRDFFRIPELEFKHREGCVFGTLSSKSDARDVGATKSLIKQVASVVCQERSLNSSLLFLFLLLSDSLLTH